MIVTLKRKYNLTDAGLIQEADSIKNSAVRDLADLAPFNVTTTTLNQLVTMRTNFSNFPTDEESSGVMMIATADKNQKRDLVRQLTRNIMVRVENKYGASTPQVRIYGANAVSTLNDEELVRCAYRVLRLANADLTNLASEGLDALILNTYTTAVDAFDEAIDIQDSAIRQRDIDTDARITLGNELYDMMSKICNYGKATWENTSEAKFNDYVIYRSSTQSAQVFSGTLQPHSIVNVSATGITGSEIVTIENSGNEVIEAYFAANPTDEPLGVSVSVPAHTTQAFPVSDLGFVPLTATRLNLKNASANANGYLVRVEG